MQANNLRSQDSFQRNAFLQRFPKTWNPLPGNIAAGEQSSPLHLEGRTAILPSKDSPSREEFGSIIKESAISYVVLCTGQKTGLASI